MLKKRFVSEYINTILLLIPRNAQVFSRKIVFQKNIGITFSNIKISFQKSVSRIFQKLK